MNNKKKWYLSNKTFLREYEALRSFKCYRNNRIRLKKIIKTLNNSKITPKYYLLIQEAYILTIKLPLLKKNAEKECLLLEK